ncbi:hypothetical protein [Taibaiella sp. KBW10]|uniref:hypothetical protein n=1 Tax=Taibaiella sp. KBW10 TaxID=2153357 RepID=UPI000F5B35B2|nr:hypothetical protein [Taibaiella sp. KBW10]
MKKLFFATVTATALLISSFAQAQSSNKLVYNKSLNPTIEIELGNIITTTSFYIKNEKGQVVKKGSINKNGKITLPTAELKNGRYRFEILGITQDFEIK